MIIKGPISFYNTLFRISLDFALKCDENYFGLYFGKNNNCSFQSGNALLNVRGLLR